MANYCSSLFLRKDLHLHRYLVLLNTYSLTCTIHTEIHVPLRLPNKTHFLRKAQVIRRKKEYTQKEIWKGRKPSHEKWSIKIDPHTFMLKFLLRMLVRNYRVLYPMARKLQKHWPKKLTSANGGHPHITDMVLIMIQGLSREQEVLRPSLSTRLKWLQKPARNLQARCH